MFGGPIRKAEKHWSRVNKELLYFRYIYILPLSCVPLTSFIVMSSIQFPAFLLLTPWLFPGHFTFHGFPLTWNLKPLFHQAYSSLHTAQTLSSAKPSHLFPVIPSLRPLILCPSSSWCLACFGVTYTLQVTSGLTMIASTGLFLYMTLSFNTQQEVNWMFVKWVHFYCIFPYSSTIQQCNKRQTNSGRT